MKSTKLKPFVYALGAAVLFGAGIPCSKILLGHMGPVTLASLLYLGSGIGLSMLILVRCLSGKDKPRVEARLNMHDLPWLAGAILSGGVMAPVILIVSLEKTPAATASLLLNFEAVATTFIAMFLFREQIGRRIWLALGLITLGSIALSWNSGGEWGVSSGAAGVILACILWGVDNNLIRNISAKDPVHIVAIKGSFAGLFSLGLAVLLHNVFPGLIMAVAALLVGFLSYGISIVFFILALRGIGAARTGALFSTAPFIGAIISIVLFREISDMMFYFALPAMAAGFFLLAGETHSHGHVHEIITHEHRHAHDDFHHIHTDNLGEVRESGEHLHPHIHERVEHEHLHSPDIHHRHMHEK